ncbi:unnamed protein product [Protopolystoma xenopodis]|uniref:Uncharacterized protein n=1 Tax=Protopolystoma xenopodis TaxID=117903 RepID=A0A3S5BWK1_9PLAT|nr:unnamed protein product [Protopolystoma xenopodis]
MHVDAVSEAISFDSGEKVLSFRPSPNTFARNGSELNISYTFNSSQRLANIIRIRCARARTDLSEHLFMPPVLLTRRPLCKYTNQQKMYAKDKALLFQASPVWCYHVLSTNAESQTIRKHSSPLSRPPSQLAGQQSARQQTNTTAHRQADQHRVTQPYQLINWVAIWICDTGPEIGEGEGEVFAEKPDKEGPRFVPSDHASLQFVYML